MPIDIIVDLVFLQKKQRIDLSEAYVLVKHPSHELLSTKMADKGMVVLCIALDADRRGRASHYEPNFVMLLTLHKLAEVNNFDSAVKTREAAHLKDGQDLLNDFWSVSVRSITVHRMMTYEDFP